MAKSKKILRPPKLAMSVSTTEGSKQVSSIHVKSIMGSKGNPELYQCDLLDADGKILKKNHTCIRGKQPFTDLTDGEISSLFPKKSDEPQKDPEIPVPD